MKDRMKKLPHIGQRIVKSSIAVFMCFVVDIFRQAIPFYSALSALQCMQQYNQNTKAMAKQRLTGTFVGAFFGLVVLLIDLNFLAELQLGRWLSHLLVALGIVAVIYSTVLLKKKNTSYFSCVVYLSITMIHMTDSNPYLFVLNRVCDTIIGVFIGLTINNIHLPRKLNKETLFITGLDNVLIDGNGKLKDYSKVELNRLIDGGMNFSVMTMRTPASLIDVAKEIHFKLPVIVMNGAVLYDIKNNHFLLKHEIPHCKAVELHKFFNENNVHCFVNIIEESSVIIQYHNFKNDGEKAIYEKYRKSPYRNYIKRPEDTFDYNDVVYFMVMEKSSVIDTLKERMLNEKFDQFAEIITYKSTDYNGYSYMKVFTKGVGKKAMLSSLKSYVNKEKSCSIGTIDGIYDIVVEENVNGDEVVQQLKALSNPLRFTKAEKNSAI